MSCRQLVARIYTVIDTVNDETIKAFELQVQTLDHSEYQKYGKILLDLIGKFVKYSEDKSLLVYRRIDPVKRWINLFKLSIEQGILPSPDKKITFKEFTKEMYELIEDNSSNLVWLYQEKVQSLNPNEYQENRKVLDFIDRNIQFVKDDASFGLFVRSALIEYLHESKEIKITQDESELKEPAESGPLFGLLQATEIKEKLSLILDWYQLTF